MERSECNRTHRVCVQFTKDYFESNNTKTIISQNPNYDLIVDGRKCKVLAHKKESGKFVVEYVCGDRSMDSVEYDDIIYMDPTYKREFYRVPIKEVFNTIQEGMRDMRRFNKKFTSVTNNNVLKNGGICIGIDESVFRNINGFVKYIF